MAGRLINRNYSFAAPFVFVFGAAFLAAQTAVPDLKSLELRGDSEFQSRDCAAAEKTYTLALQLAQSANDLPRTSLYYLRLASCRARVGDFAGTLDNYRQGMPVVEAAGDPEWIASYLHGSAVALGNLGRADEARPLIEREYAIAQQCGHPAHMARGLWMMAGSFGSQGRTREQIEWLNRALAVSRTTTDDALTGVIFGGLALAYNALGDLETAESMEKQILAMPLSAIASTRTTYSRAITYNNLGDIQMKNGRVNEARISFELAIEGSGAPERWRAHATALLNLAGIQNRAGEIPQSDKSFHDALQLIQNVKFADLECAAWKMRSDDLLVRRASKDAVEAGTEALRIARTLNSSSRTYDALVALGSARSAAGFPLEARAAFEEAIGIAEKIRAQSPGEISDLGRSYANLLPLYQASVRNLLDLHLPAEALQRAEEAKARVLMNILSRRRGRDGCSHARRKQRAVFLRKRLAAAQDPQSPQARDALVEYRQFRRALYRNHPELEVRSVDFEPATSTALSGLLAGPESALLEYFTVPDGLALFVIRPASTQGTAPHITNWLLPDPRHNLAGEIRLFRDSLAHRDLTYKSQARHLFARLVQPAMAELRGTTDWIVSPDGALWELPFAALIDSAGQHLIEKRALALTPSLTAALAIRMRATPDQSNSLSLLALGNPLPAPVPLPDAAREVNEIGAHYPADRTLILTGTSATAEAFQINAGNAQIIHLAAHAALNNIDPLSSAVNLSAATREGRDPRGMVASTAPEWTGEEEETQEARAGSRALERGPDPTPAPRNYSCTPACRGRFNGSAAKQEFGRERRSALRT